MKDDLGNRMKHNFEDRTRHYLPRRTYTIVRVDGKAFHGLTKGCDRPFDINFMHAMNDTALTLCEEIQGARCAFVQSDEISFLLTDFETIKTDAWFDGNLQKIVSVVASMATSTFSALFDRVALFDARAFTIPDPTEVENYFIWRQKDAMRNAIQMAAQSIYSPQELHGKSCLEQLDMLSLAGFSWRDHGNRARYGGMVIHDFIWRMVDTPVFTEDRAFLTNLIPRYPA